MGILVRRAIVSAALIFWLGGTTFYGVVVVPVGRHLLGSVQSLVTREVTQILNYTSLVALLILAWDLLAGSDPSRRRRRARWVCWAMCAVTLPILFWLHHDLGAQMDAAAAGQGTFHTEHRIYIAIGGWQSLAAACFAVLTLAAWQAAERQADRSQD